MSTEGYARVAEGALDRAWPRPRRGNSSDAHGRFPGGELVVLGLGRLRRPCADPRVGPRHHLSAHGGAGRRCPTARKPLGPNDYFNRLASRVTAALSVPTAAGPLYEVDTRLRPEGAKGMLVVSLDAFERYQREEAWTWEHMALCRARPVFGSPKRRGRASRR